MTKKSICDTLRRTCLILAGSFIMAVNLKSFVRAGGLIPGGFNGLTRLIQEISVLLWHWEPPFSVINFILNAVPVVISFKFIGKKFTGYSCLMIVVSGILTDMVPAWPVTEDILLIAIFGGLINALAISLCLFANATSGGTDFIAIFLSEKYSIDSWCGKCGDPWNRRSTVWLGQGAVFHYFSVYLHAGTPCAVQALPEADTDHRDETAGGCLRSYCGDHPSRCHPDQG